MPLTTQQFNEKIESWAISKAAEMNSQIASMGAVDTGNLFRMLRAKLRFAFGEADSISYKMPRYGILLEKGAGRGSKKGNGAGFSAIARKPKPWFTNVINDQSISELADIVAEFKADKAMGDVADQMTNQIAKKFKVK